MKSSTTPSKRRQNGRHFWGEKHRHPQSPGTGGRVRVPPALLPTHLLGRLRFELFGVEHVDFEIPEGFPELAVDLVINFGEVQKLGVDRGDELRRKTEELTPHKPYHHCDSHPPKKSPLAPPGLTLK